MRLVWTAPAEADLYEIAGHYAQFDEDLPLKVLRRIYDAPLILLERPRLGGETLWPHIRKWPTKHTPFILLYVARLDDIEVRRVVHNRSDWRNFVP